VIRDAELRAQRATTRAFIKADVVQVVIERAEYGSDGAGGEIKGDLEPLPAQLARLIPMQDGSTPRVVANGEQVVPKYMLMGEWDFDVQRFDEFTLNGRRYQVVFINENQQYEVKAEVAYLDGI
jgi:hypothetical protein